MTPPRSLGPRVKARGFGTTPSVHSRFKPCSFGGSWRARAEQVPGFTVFFKTSAVALLCALGIKPNVYTIHNLGDGHDVPGIVGDDVGGDEIDFLGGILNMAAPALGGGSDSVFPAGGGKTRLKLNAEHAALPPDDEVVRFAVAIGVADCESQA